jgi:hypothetical protein
MDFSEKRGFHRMVLDRTMEYQLENETKSCQAKVINLSAKGIFYLKLVKRCRLEAELR